MYQYYVEYWDNLNNCDGEDTGLVAAENYSQAINKVTEYYGEKNVSHIRLTVYNNPITFEELKEELLNG